MTRNRERLEANEQTVEFSSDDLDFFTQLEQPLHVLVIAEDWCGDVIANLPVLGRLAAETGKLDMRVFLRDQNLDLIDQYLKEGKYRSIPVFVFFNTAFEELGHWIERPARITELQAQMRHDLFEHDARFAGLSPDTPIAQLPDAARERLTQASAEFRQQNRNLADREVVREIRAVLAGGAQARPAAAPRAATTTVPRAPAKPAAGKHPVKVSITYCAACGYEPQTLALTSALMQEFIYDLASIELIPWQDGAFDVVVDGELVHSMYRDGGFPEHTTIINAVRERLG
jgi:selT/selW/selH-like putative selenoprotein